MKNLFRLSYILSLLALTVYAHAQRIIVARVKHPGDCQFATAQLIKDLRGIGFPRDWTIVVACNPIVWEKLQRRGDAFGTNTALHEPRGHHGRERQDLP